MGGLAEDTVSPEQGKEQGRAQGKSQVGELLLPSVKQTSKFPRVSDLTQAIRFHISGSHVHFHVDPGKGTNITKMKVAIPVAEWWTAFERLKNLRTERYQYIDHEEGCMLIVEAGINDESQFEIIPTLSKIAEGTGPVFDKLEEFITKARKNKK